MSDSTKIFTIDEVETVLSDWTIVLKEGVWRKTKTPETNDVNVHMSDWLIKNLGRSKYWYWRGWTWETWYISTTQRKTD